MEQLLVKKMREDAIIPQYAKEGDAGFDLFTAIDMVIPPKTTKAIPTGIALEIPKGHEVQLRPRSGISLNGLNVDVLSIEQDLSVTKTASTEYIRVQLGTVDEGYKAELGIITTNPTHKWVLIRKGTKLAQAVLNKVKRGSLALTEMLSDSERGTQGFGSTGQ